MYLEVEGKEMAYLYAKGAAESMAHAVDRAYLKRIEKEEIGEPHCDGRAPRVVAKERRSWQYLDLLLGSLVKPAVAMIQ